MIMSRILRPERGDLPPQAAEWVLSTDFDPVDKERMIELYEKAKEGALTPLEDAELEDYGAVTRLLELMKAKAKISLRRSGRGAEAQ